LAYYAKNNYPWQNAAGLKRDYLLGTLGAERVEPLV